jgi:hypothetical protein
MSEVALPTTPAPTHRRQTKFTPANIRQIINLLERGKSKEEIAEIIGVTPATLQVTCSRLGISLRRPTLDGIGLNRPRRPRPQNGDVPNRQEPDERMAQTVDRDEQIQIAPEAANVDEDHTIIRLHPNQEPTKSADVSGVTLTIRYRGEERTVDSPVDRNALGLFALEAEFRSMGIGDLIAQALLSIAKNDLFNSVLEPSPRQAGKSKSPTRSGRPTTEP